MSLLRWDLCVRTRTHEPQSVLPLASRTPPAHVYPQTQPKLFVSEALFSSSLAPQPSFRQINIAPEIAGISGIFERSRWKGGESWNKGALCDTLEVRGGRRRRRRRGGGSRGEGVTLPWVVDGVGSISKMHIYTDKQVQVTQFLLTPLGAPGPGVRAKADLPLHRRG